MMIFTKRFWRDPSLCCRLALLLLLVCSSPSPAAESERLTAAGWEYYRGGLGGIWEVWRGAAASDNVKWAPVELPHCFNGRDSVDPDEAYYQGEGWYRTKLKLDNPFQRGRTLLRFEGAGQKSQVYVGLDKVGDAHVGGYNEFLVDITEAAAKASESAEFDGGVPLAVMCDNSRDLEMMPSDLSDFVIYGGLYRHVSRLYVPAISLRRVHIEPTVSPDKPATVKIRAELYNPESLDDEVEVEVKILGPDGKLVHESRKRLRAWKAGEQIDQLEIDSPQLWSPAKPQLYTCSVTLSSPHGEHESRERFGLRYFEFVEHGPFKLNGERLLLRGTHFHEDHVGVGAAVPDDAIRKMLRMIKDMGANFLRLGHYPQSKLVLDQCDELGLLVWEEIPWCRGGLGGEEYRQQGRDMLRAMIDQHYNHPAVILWGLGNENDWPGDFEEFDQEKIRAYMKELHDLAHELDPARRTCIRRCDFCKDIVDVYSPSIWAGWYRGQYTEYRESAETEIQRVKHFFHAEWGGDSHAGRHSEDPDKGLAQVATGQGTDERGLDYLLKGGIARVSVDGDWSESYICNLFDWHLKEQEKMPQLTGSAQWIFKDFATPLRPTNPVPRMNQKGVVERDLTPKDSYYVFQSYWAEKPMIHIYGHSWPVRWGEAGEEKTVKVYSNCSEVELEVNGESVGSKQRNSQNFPAAGLRWMVPLREGRNTVRTVGHKGSEIVVDEISFEYRTEKWGPPAKLTIEQIGRRGDVAIVHARLLDAEGVQCLDARNVVRFGATGDARLIDNLGTSTGSRVVEMYNGRAEISIQLTGPTAVASVTSEGIPTAIVTLEGGAGAGDGEEVARPQDRPAGSIDVGAVDRERILKAATVALDQPPITITAHRAELSEGGPHDFYSNGDYWWPDPQKPDGLPYIRRDGESNPGNFSQHRLAVKELRDSVAALAAAYKLTGDDRYATKGAGLLRVFFLDSETRMNPSLNYAQAIPGITPGRGIGIIDALHLAEVPLAIRALRESTAFPAETHQGLRQWFGELAEWMVTSQHGQEEANTENNHAVAYFLQLAVFADFIGDEEKLAESRRRFREVFVPQQMAVDGGFPQELRRTKPYGYSIFQLDNMAALCQVLSTPEDNLWEFELGDGRGMRQAMAYLYPYLEDKSKWPYEPDIQAWEGWPARQPSLLFAGLAYDEQKYLELWKRLPADPTDPEVQRNIAITQPILWID